MSTPARIAFVTMVRDEPVFLPLWIAHYAKIAPREHMFVIVDGFDQRIPEVAEGLQVIQLPQIPVAAGFDEARWRMLTAFANALLERFDIVVLNDVDELIVLDPQFGDDLAGAIAEAQQIGVISPFAVDMIHRTDLEPAPLVPDAPILRQRRYVRINATYAKPCITARPIRWSLGGHLSDFPTLHLSPKLYLFHLRALDREMMRARQAKRLQLVSDASGMVIAGVAGPSWRVGTDEVDAYLEKFVERGPPQDHGF
ncbi:MAG: glycosyltransferase family 2 protein, partial [Paracoccaceae bacterium]